MYDQHQLAKALACATSLLSVISLLWLQIVQLLSTANLTELSLGSYCPLLLQTKMTRQAGADATRDAGNTVTVSIVWAAEI